MRNKTLTFAVTTVLLGSMAVILAQGPNSQRRGPGREAAGSGRGGQLGLISALPYEELNQVEEDALSWMWEEEKLARDVYLALYEQWELPIFWRIASSEQRHMDAVGALLEKYNIAESAQFQAGEFASPEFGELYKDLVNMGMASEDKALYVGATIEDLDISDLRRQLDLVDNRDIQMVFGNLLRGSMNHLRAFNRLLAGDYVAQYLTQEEVDEIISMPAERGGYGVRNRQSGECGTERGPGNGQCRRRGSPGN